MLFLEKQKVSSKPHWHIVHLPIPDNITKFKCMWFWKHRVYWPPLLCSLHSLLLAFLMWFITSYPAGYISPCAADTRRNWVMLLQFCEGNKMLSLGLWTYSLKVTSREILSGHSRRQLSTWSAPGTRGWFRSKREGRRHSVEVHSFILIQLTITLVRLQRC